MEWLNIRCSALDSSEFIGAGPTERATWLCLMRFCAGQENGGRIVGCSGWNNRKWQQLVRVTFRETRADTVLWYWDGDDLIVSYYFAEKEVEIQRLRGQASAAATARWKKERERKMPGGMPDGIASGTSGGIAEEKGIEENRNSLSAPTAFHRDPSTPQQAGAERRKRVLTLLTLYGCTLKIKGECIFAEWCNAIGHYPVDWLEHLFHVERHRPALPSALRKLLKESHADYVVWENQRPKQHGGAA